MTLHDYAELLEYWADHPPSHLIEAARIGHKPRSRAPLRPADRPSPARRAAAPAAELGGLLGLAPHGTGTLEALKGLG